MKRVALLIVLLLTSLAHAQTTTTSTSTTSTLPWCDPDLSEEVLVPTGLKKPERLQCNWRQVIREDIDLLNMFCFPGVSCNVSLPAETYGTLPLGRLEDDDGTPDLCLTSGGLGIPMWQSCELTRTHQMCRLFEPVRDTDVDEPIGISPGDIELINATCHCYGSCIDPMFKFTFKDREQNDIPLIGGGSLTCGRDLEPDPKVLFDDVDPNRIMVENEGLHIERTQGPTDPTDRLLVCARFRFL